MNKHSHRKSLRVAAVLVAAATVLTFVPASAASATSGSQKVIVGMGDSFTSGEGAPPFFPDTDTSTDQCHRSLVAYPLTASVLKPHASGRNVACSGAVTDDLFRTFKTESAQASRLSGATDIVLTIGGNDINALGAVSNPPTAEEFAAELAALFPKLVTTYQRVHAAAPSATIHVLGYPYLFPAGAATTGCPFDAATRTYLLSAQTGLNSTIAAAAATAGVQYIDDSTVFAGHEVCTAHPWVNGIDTTHPAYSLHPNQAGQVALGVKVAQNL